jgi:hypothetical protein
VAIKAPISPSTAAHLHMQTHYAHRIMCTCFITTVRRTPVLRRTPYIKLIKQRPIKFFILVQSAFAAQFLYYVQAFTVFFHAAESLESKKVLNHIFSPVLWNSTGSLLHPQNPITCRWVLREINPVQRLPNRLNIILPSILRSSMLSF